MAQPENRQLAPEKPKRRSVVKWIAVVVVVIIVVAAAIVVVTYHPPSTPAKKPVYTKLAITATTSGIITQVGAPVTFTPVVPSTFKWTKMVWNFGDGTSGTLACSLWKHFQ
ncbi:MAG: hypothetical protein ACP5UO_02100 [Thermoplasmata archaeon]